MLIYVKKYVLRPPRPEDFLEPPKVTKEERIKESLDHFSRIIDGAKVDDSTDRRILKHLIPSSDFKEMYDQDPDPSPSPAKKTDETIAAIMPMNSFK